MRGIASNLGGGFKCLDNLKTPTDPSLPEKTSKYEKKSHVDFWRPKSQFDEQMFRIEATT